MLSRKIKWVVASIIIGGTILALSFVNMDQNSVYFYTPAEAVEKAATLSKENIRVGGMVKVDSVQWDRPKLSLAFILSDLKGTEIHVQHRGTPPDLFKENAGVIVEGSIAAEGNSFLATKLMVKHSEEYRQPEHGGTQADKSLLTKSLAL
ncbi:MAG: cytochrome c maturation protein CcmE [Deltaproteobacteria bacterium]|nr:cytochrome c maturation protein CcmE [Deltaproteobacteria bacterium]